MYSSRKYLLRLEEDEGKGVQKTTYLIKSFNKSHINKQTTYENPLLQQQQQQSSKTTNLAGMRTFKPSSSSLNSTSATNLSTSTAKYTNGGNNSEAATSGDIMVTTTTTTNGAGGTAATLTSTSSLNAGLNTTSQSTSTLAHRRPNQPPKSQPSSTANFYFTQNPDELRGEFIKTSLLKSSHGFGFTIIGANETSEDFLQIKYIVPDGAADRDRLLRQGDVLVYVNNECVLGYTHQDVVEIFQVNFLIS